LKRYAAREPASGLPWINPIGGLGDTLMVSGVLKLVIEEHPSRRFNLIRRTSYLGILKGHPAIADIGHPPVGATILGTDYWNKEELGPCEKRAFQVLSRMFGLRTPVEERLYLPGEMEKDPLLHDRLPWRERNILIAPASISPRKEMPPVAWNQLVELLRQEGCFVAQAGRLNQVHIRNAYSLLGLTTPRQLVALLRRFNAVITSDNYVMHAAHLAGTPAIVLWGPTDHRIYGYECQIHLQAPRMCGPDVECIGPLRPGTYQTACPLGLRQCMNQISMTEIMDAVRRCPSSGTINGLERDARGN